ncbi:alpha/beta hydrolase [Crossiella cryophila]|uniref:Pimeloyl-ACP methyl ester carboxylesterase n=1 Tax=Crossiella cryophila TaxID=43355 RepID=A0A7W7CBW2_9PSEU|nr:alpha/beta fold hydrolase [Crossiella cryophila]MBB4678270.1 pimeloyl-ACP methyl ester carboxylesterase [Crossiella cryophila]
MTRTRTHLAAAFVSAMLLTTAAGPADAAMAGGPVCATHTLSVRIADAGPATETLRGRLCLPRHRRPSAVQLLVHGATYDHRYWDFPVGGGSYSYVRAAAVAGYATFNVDRIGAGASSQPLSQRLDAVAGAAALHDVVTALRTGAVGGRPFARAIYVGHSLGSFIGLYGISRYRDVDAAILTGMLHGYNAGPADIMYPAGQDPKFARSNLDEGYLTTRPGTRGGEYYHPATADPRVIAADESGKDVTTLGPPPPMQVPHPITVPVLLVTGAEDRLACVGVTQYDCADPESVRAHESRFFLPETRLDVRIIPGTGHSLALSTTAPATTVTMLQWSRSTISP